MALGYGRRVLTEVAPGVHVRQSAYCRTNTTVVLGGRRALVVDPGVTAAELDGLARDLDRLGATVALGFATHPHWDHVLWHRHLGTAPRVATAGCVRTAAERRRQLLEEVAAHAPGVEPELVGRLDPLPGESGTRRLPWDGPPVEVVEHRGHAAGHAALLVRDAGVLVAGDMLSDVEVPLLDPDGDDPAGDYAAALGTLAATCRRGVRVVVPGHGDVATGAAVGARIAADVAYVAALRDGADPVDPRLGPAATYGRDWLPEAHQANARLARR